MIGDVAGWIAPVATMAAAMMTAANLGSRFTGWGFVVFLVGSVAWVTVAVSTGQPNLMWSNMFLTVVNVIGIWRWLGRQANLDDGAKVASERSEAAPAPTLFSAGLLQDQPLNGPDGQPVGRVAGAMVECGRGQIAYLLVGEGGVAGIGERLHMLGWHDLHIEGGTLSTRLDAAALAALPEVAPDSWPERGPPRRG
jgi:hypothetical protein